MRGGAHVVGVHFRVVQGTLGQRGLPVFLYFGCVVVLSVRQRSTTGEAGREEICQHGLLVLAINRTVIFFKGKEKKNTHETKSPS